MAEFSTSNLVHVGHNTGALPENDEDADLLQSAMAIQGSDVKSWAKDFIRNYREGNHFIYRDAMLNGYNKKEHFLQVHLLDVLNFSEMLATVILENPQRYITQFEAAAKDVLRELAPFASDLERAEVHDIQIMFISNHLPTRIRDLNGDTVGKLVKVPGIIINAATTKAKTVNIRLRCTKCHHIKDVQSLSPLGSTPNIPSKCLNENAGEERACGPNPYTVVPNQCKYIDQQFLKLQECPEEVPTGEMPRHIMAVCDRALVDRVAPGTRVHLMAISSTYTSNSKKVTGTNFAKTPYLHVYGIEIQNAGSGRAMIQFTPEEEEKFIHLSRQPDIYERIYKSVAPSLSGEYTVDIKKAVACLLFGGCRKALPDGTKLRGDINVLLLGDPSTAKSQFLKFVEKVAPVGVYTSGRGSSAAGLTASVIRDKKGEFYLEGGAMVLADGGVVCIDEFDKMDEKDRVAIHEAMEQQTISIAKAGITTILNSRTSVLAAANPVHGRYDDSISAAQNIDFMPTILSRFDLIFIVRDVRDAERDSKMAQWVINVHVDGHNINHAQVEGEIDFATMKSFICFARSKCAPRLNEEASRLLIDTYVKIRDEVRARALAAGVSAKVPITVRQLEAIIRISESLAKMALQIEVTPVHVEEALRLFKVSTLNAASNNEDTGDVDAAEVSSVEDLLKRRIAIGARVSKSGILTQFTSSRIGFSEAGVMKALSVMNMRGEIEFLDQRRTVHRLR